MAFNSFVHTGKAVRSFLRYQLTACPFADERLQWVQPKRMDGSAAGK